MIDDRSGAEPEPKADEPEVVLSGKDVIRLYVHLSSQESGLAPNMVGILDRIEKELFRCLTIEQIEQIESLYRDTGRPRETGAVGKEKRR